MPHWKSAESPRKRGRPLTYEEKRMVYHSFESFERDKHSESVIIVEDPYEVTSRYIGVSGTTVANIAKSVRNTGRVPATTFPGNRSQVSVVPVIAEERIRDFVFEKHRDGPICNATHVAALLKSEFGLDINIRTMQRHLVRMGFCWSRTKKKMRSLRENDRIRQQRHDYLYEIRKNRQLSPKKHYDVVCLDESFLHHHYGSRFSWISGEDFIERSTGKGRRWCFIHAVRENGLLENTFLIFEGKKSKGDYHHQFDHLVFQKWFRQQLLPNLKKHSLIVTDRCPFHMVGKDSILPKQMKKAELRQWLTDQGFKWEEKWSEPRLPEEVENRRDKKTMVEIFAEKQGHRVIFLPVHHPESNPIELVWNTAKGSCARLFSNETSFQDQRKRSEAAFESEITKEYCLKTFEHIRKVEDKYWETDLILDDYFDQEIGQIGGEFDYIL
jgi:transposase